MPRHISVKTITGTSPASETVAAVGAVIGGLSAFEGFTIDATTLGATGGTLDLVLQRKIEGVDEWRDWLRLPQLADAASVIYHTIHCGGYAGVTPTVHDVGKSTTAVPVAPVLAADTAIGGHPGDKLRLVADAGASTSAGAAQTIRVTCWRPMY